LPEQSGNTASLEILMVGVTIGMAVTGLLLATELPHVLDDLTVILPLALPTVTVIEFVVEVPVQPVGMVQM
jgi:hypothetical protein